MIFPPSELGYATPRRGDGTATQRGNPVMWRRRLHNGLALTGVVLKEARWIVPSRKKN